MPTPMTEAGIIAKRLGKSTQAVKYRLDNGIPLDRPWKHGDVEKRLETMREEMAKRKEAREERKRREKAAAAKARKARQAAQERANRRRAAQAKRNSEAARQRAERLAAKEAAWERITASPRETWSNPLALLAGHDRARTTKPTAREMCARCVSAVSGGLNYGT